MQFQNLTTQKSNNELISFNKKDASASFLITSHSA